MGFWHLGRTRRRRPYGRRTGSHPWVEDPAILAMQHVPYHWTFPSSRAVDRERERTWQEGDLDGRAPRTKTVPMPHGGVRYLFRCPLCKSWRMHLYNVMALVFVCRRCLGLRYRSQYIGRRVDATRERIEEARVALARAEAEAEATQQRKAAARRTRRAASARLRRQQATWRARHQRLDRAERTYEWRQDAAEMRELARVAAWCASHHVRLQRRAARAGLDTHEVA